MMRPNHEFWCSLSPGFRNWVEMTRNMQHARVPTASRIPGPCSRASLRGGPIGRVWCAVGGRGGEKPTGAAGAHVLGGGERGWGGD